MRFNIEQVYAGPGARFRDSDARILAASIWEIANKRKRAFGAVDPDWIVEEAKAEHSPIHNYFDWNDAVAALKWRREQAKYYLRHIVVMVTENAEPVRLFVDISLGKPGTPNYVSVDTAMAEPGLADLILRKAKEDFESYRRRYQSYRQLRRLFEAADEIFLHV